ncbi:MAG: hypothetical protein ACJ72W_03750 [Actinoallomurus sp.]
MLKKTCATGVLALTAAAGALLTSSPASAQVPTGGGGWGDGCCRSSHFRSHSSHRNLNWNNNKIFNHIPIRIHNRNNNVAIARNGQEQRERQGEFQFQRDGRFDGEFGGLGGFGDDD